MAVGEGGRGRREREMSSRSDGQPSKSERPHRLDACGFSRKLVIYVYIWRSTLCRSIFQYVLICALSGGAVSDWGSRPYRLCMGTKLEMSATDTKDLYGFWKARGLPLDLYD